jgi:TetR/AcrR family transcriptional regulator, transcriptional repressor for nem operon
VPIPSRALSSALVVQCTVPSGDKRAVQETQRKGSNTRERILDVAEAAVLEKGFAATSIEELIAAVAITKSGFFYHFKDKNELARALLVRYVEREDTLFDDLFHRADELNEDPLHGFLVGLKMMSELMADLPNGHPGCLVASFCYQDRLFDKEVRDLNTTAVLNWRKRFRERLELIAARYPPKSAVDLDDLADMLSVIADGGIILSRVVNDKQALPRQIMLYRDFIRTVFLGS